MNQANLTVGQRDAANRTYEGTYADLEQILYEWDVVIIDEVDDNPERNPHVGAADLEKSGLLDALMAWRDAANGTALPLFPGHPGTLWRDMDGDGDLWITGDDERMYQCAGPVSANEVASFYGPMIREGGEI